MRERRFAEALPILREVLAKDPRNAFAQLVLGSAYMGMNDYRAAIAQYRRYLELVPTSAYAHQWMAICYLRLGDRQNAVREADAALAIDPRFSDARILKGGVLAARGDYPGALAELRAAVEADPAKPIIRLDLAKVLGEAGQEAEAQAQFEAALELQPDYAPALDRPRRALCGAGPVRAGGQRRCSARWRSSPRQEEARFNLAKVYERHGPHRRGENRVPAPGRTRRRTSPAVRSAARQQLAVARGRGSDAGTERRGGGYALRP